jgi:cyclophilin family peptidyl-prolyl cis-trans isomerase
MRRLTVTLALLASLGPAGRSQSDDTPVVETKPDATKAKTEFAELAAALRASAAKLMTLQADYQKPGSDKPKIEADFEKEVAARMATFDRLATAAVAVCLADPETIADETIVEEARLIAGRAVKQRMDADDPSRGLALAEMLGTANAAGADVSLLAATACLTLSRLDEAEGWLGRAEAAGADAARLGDLRAEIARSRPKWEAERKAREKDAAADDLPRVRLTTSQGPIVIELFEDEAPNTVANFVSLVEKHFYDGLVFHRVIGGFMAQGGDPTGSGSGGPGHAIRCECGSDKARNHFAGTLSMAHAGKDTGGSQFFLTFRPTEHLDGRHTVFGRVIEGMDVLPKLARTEGPAAAREPDRIVKAEVIRKRDHAYEPETLPDPR